MKKIFLFIVMCLVIGSFASFIDTNSKEIQLNDTIIVKIDTIDIIKISKEDLFKKMIKQHVQMDSLLGK